MTSPSTAFDLDVASKTISNALASLITLMFRGPGQP
jgi:hypothetical protein